MSILQKIYYAVIMILFVVIMGAFLTSPKWATDEEGALKALQTQGYTEISFHGYSYTGCSKEDIFITKFSAKSINGTPVSGVVCKGILKGATIRTY